MNEKIVQLKMIFYYWPRWKWKVNPLYDKKLFKDLVNYICYTLDYNLFHPD